MSIAQDHNIPTLVVRGYSSFSLGDSMASDRDILAFCKQWIKDCEVYLDMQTGQVGYDNDTSQAFHVQKELMSKYSEMVGTGVFFNDITPRKKLDLLAEFIEDLGIENVDTQDRNGIGERGEELMKRAVYRERMRAQFHHVTGHDL